MIPITDIDDPRLTVATHWADDVRSPQEVEASVLRAPKRLAALLQAIRETTMIGERERIFNRTREILGE